MAILFTALTFFSTFLGGLVSFRYKDKLHVILGFTAGVLLGVVVFDILPEIMQLSQKIGMDVSRAMIALIVGFLLFHVAEKLLLVHHAQEELYGAHKHPTVGVLSAIALSGHSFLDGVGIGLGFQVSSAIGIIIATAVIAHDFSDGLNTVSLLLTHHNAPRKALQFLAVDAIAPVLGSTSTLFFSLPESFLVMYLGFFAGFLLYIGASDILPEAHSHGASLRAVVATLIGVIFVFLVTRLV